MPAGAQFEFNQQDPALATFKRIAHEAGLSQEVFPKALGAYAATQLEAQQNFTTARNAEIEKLGPNMHRELIRFCAGSRRWVAPILAVQWRTTCGPRNTSSSSSDNMKKLMQV